MQKACLVLVACASLFAAACETRSLSQPFQDPYANRTYRGEMNDWDVVGTALPHSDPALGVPLRTGQRVLLVQSGASMPDDAMRAAISAHFHVDGGSGLPTDAARNEHGLRGAAARGGYDLVIAFWGTIEVQREATGSAMSWVPIVNIWANTSAQRARIRLRLVVLDVKTGNWRTIEAVPQDSSIETSIASHSEDDVRQMERLKAAAYAAARDALDKLVRE